MGAVCRRIARKAHEPEFARICSQNHRHDQVDGKAFSGCALFAGYSRLDEHTIPT
jgi:hypothetical protein